MLAVATQPVVGFIEPITLDQPINWRDEKYAKAPFGTLEYWQYRAACYISESGKFSRQETDAIRLRLGQLAFEQGKTHATSIWHATAVFFGSSKCQCGNCNGQIKDLKPWSEVLK